MSADALLAPESDPQRREVARLTALSEDDWQEELAATLWDCERLLRIDIDEILAAPRRPPMPAEDRRALRRAAALHLLKTTTEAA